MSAESEKVPNTEAAKILGCTVEYLRRQMKSGEWAHLGSVIKPGRGKVNYRCHVYRDRLNKHLGKEE